jgi:hypothetical protein
VQGNAANLSEGGLSLGQGAEATIADSIVEGNTAHMFGGGGLYASHNSRVAIIHSSLHSSFAQQL